MDSKAYAEVTQDEKLEHITCFLYALEADNKEEAQRLGNAIPVHPRFALSLKNNYGIEFLKSSGFNLCRAEESYGKNWLSQ